MWICMGCAGLLPAQELRLGIPLSHAIAPTRLAVSDDGTKAASGSPDHSILLRETETGKALQRFNGHQAAISGLQFLSNDRLLSWSSDGTLKIWSCRNHLQPLRHSLEAHRSPVTRVLPFQKILLSSDESGLIISWDTANGKRLQNLQAHQGALLALHALPDGRIFSASAQDGWKVWTIDKQQLQLQHSGNLPAQTALLEVAADGTLFLCTRDARTAILPYRNGQYEDEASLIQLPVSEAERRRFTPMFAFRRNGGNWICFSAGAICAVSPDGKTTLLSESAHARLLHATLQPSNEAIWYSRNDGSIYQLLQTKEQRFYNSSTEQAEHFIPTSNGSLLALLGGRFTALDAQGRIAFRESEPAPLSMLSGSLHASGWVYTVSTDHRIRIWDPDNGRLVQQLIGHTGTVLSIASDKSGKNLISGGRDGKLVLWNADHGKPEWQLQFKSPVVSVCAGTKPQSAYAVLADGSLYRIEQQTSTQLEKRLLTAERFSGQRFQLLSHPESDKLLVWNPDGRCDLHRLSDGKLLGRYRNTGGLRAVALHANGPVFASADGRIASASWRSFRKAKELLQRSSPIQHLRMLGGDTLACVTADGMAHVFSLRRGFLAKQTLHPGNSINLEVSGQRLVSADADGNYGLWNWKSGEPAITGRHNGGLMSALLFRDGQYLLLAGMDQFLALHDASDAHLLLRLLPLAGRDWISLHSSGLFDATQGAMENMFWIRGERILEFARLKTRFWEPGLWHQVVQRQKLRDVQGFDRIALHPDLQFGEAKNGLLPVRLRKNDGGIGRVAVYINGKEISADARGAGFNAQADSATLQIDLRKHPFLLPGQENEILVKTWTVDGLVESRGAVTRYTAPLNTGTNTKAPRFFGIVCGTGAYRNSDINLRYSVPDATAIAAGIAEGANKLFGAANTQVRLFTQPGPRPGSRENLQLAFDSIAALAKPEDIVFIYLSGHGINTGGEDGEFCYLLPEAFSADAAAYTDQQLRQRVSLGTGELSRMLNKVAALKQVLIIDACGSGKAVDNLAGKREIAPVQIRAFDRMRDRTGTFILSGCAADAVSYEASRYGQGLLTYALLQGMAGASLKDAGLLDVANWFQYARDRVPELARGIGGLQEPQMLLPRGGSIDIALVDEQVRRRIPLAQVKPVFIQSLVQDEAAFEDVLKIGELLDRRLFELSSRGITAPIAFFEVKRFEQACQLFGRYSREGERIVFKGKIKCPDGEVPLNISENNADALVTKLMEQVGQVK